MGCRVAFALVRGLGGNEPLDPLIAASALRGAGLDGATRVRTWDAWRRALSEPGAGVLVAGSVIAAGEARALLVRPARDEHPSAHDEGHDQDEEAW